MWQGRHMHSRWIQQSIGVPAATTHRPLLLCLVTPMYAEEFRVGATARFCCFLLGSAAWGTPLPVRRPLGASLESLGWDRLLPAP